MRLSGLYPSFSSHSNITHSQSPEVVPEEARASERIAVTIIEAEL